MSRRSLTKKQHAFLGFLQEHIEAHKVWPTYREIVDHFAYRSPNSVTQNLQALSRKGFLARDRNGYRLLDPEGRDGSIAVRGTLRGGAVEPADPAAARLSLAELFENLSGLHALRLSQDVARTDGLGAAEYVLVDEGEPQPGDTVVVLDGEALRLCAAEAAPNGTTRVLGRYAGHAGPYGIVRHAAEAEA